MSGKVMICLVGEQTIPNLLAVLHYKPAAVVLVHSDRTERHATNFARVISANTSSQTELCPAAAYDVAAAATSIRTLLAQAQWRSRVYLQFDWWHKGDGTGWLSSRGRTRWL